MSRTVNHTSGLKLNQPSLHEAPPDLAREGGRVGFTGFYLPSSLKALHVPQIVNRPVASSLGPLSVRRCAGRRALSGRADAADGGASDERPRLSFRRELLVRCAWPPVDLGQAHEPFSVDSWAATDADCCAYVETVRSGSEGEHSTRREGDLGAHRHRNPVWYAFP